MELSFDLPGAQSPQTLILQVDTGFYGDFPTLLIDESAGKMLGIRGGPPIPNEDAHQNVIWHPTTWVKLNMPNLALHMEVLAVCYATIPGEHQGLVGLAFLEAFFEEWGGRSNAEGIREFFVKRKNH